MNKLITKSLEESSINLLLGFPKQLLSKREVEMVEWVGRYTARFGSPPLLERFIEQFEMFTPVKERDPLEDIYERELTKKRNIHTREYILSVQDRLKAGEDPLPFIEELHNNIRGGASDIVRYTTHDRSTYYRETNSYPYGIPQIDKETGGLSKADLVYLVGRLGTGKTSVVLWFLTKWLMQELTILMVSNENRAEDIIGKIDSFIGGFNPLKKRTGRWSAEDRNKLRTVTYIAGGMEGEVYIPKRPVKDTDELNGLVFTYNPDIVIVDGIYLMNSGSKSESGWEKITGVSRELKQLAETEEIPILGIHQANRAAIGKRMEIENIAYADALAQDADLVLGINSEEDGSVFVEGLKNRWGEKDWGFFLRFFFDTMTVKVMDPALAVVGAEDGK